MPKRARSGEVSSPGLVLANLVLTDVLVQRARSESRFVLDVLRLARRLDEAIVSHARPEIRGPSSEVRRSCSHHCTETVSNELLEGGVGGFLQRRVDRFFRGGAVVAEIRQGGEQILALLIASAAVSSRGARGLQRRGKAVLQFEANTLGSLLANAGNLRQPDDVLRSDRAHQLAGVDPRQHGQ